MVTQLKSPQKTDVIYPDSDGKPMSDNTKQFRWIQIIQQNLAWLFADDPNVFIAGDLLWYPVEGNNKIKVGPDVMVALGRPKGDRGSYQQWLEENIAPQVVFEIFSPGNRFTEMNQKQAFYDRHGVEEYYLYDPNRNDFSGWMRSDGRLDVIESIENWVSPRLGIRFDSSGEELQIYRPNGEPFASYEEVSRRLEQAEQCVEQAEQRVEQAEQRAEQAEQRANLLAERLREMGIDPEQL
ncbi:Uma2 family endonuclease [Microcoleus sp. bin38.metabat.b11b12b14.051]|uniref:Uma2 family endonuclease n=1 Tax=Microcoleus sp. bin38.metabat.b11b12b14.051 TaxID=2742709 RepID=UPI0025F2E355|nr:Uma2 family endonuclease [Microcoleus sp. bin38.metabat.b11b12b14.051]